MHANRLKRYHCQREDEHSQEDWIILPSMEEQVDETVSPLQTAQENISSKQAMNELEEAQSPSLPPLRRSQRWRRHFKSGQATSNKRSLVHISKVGGLQQTMCGSKNYLWNQNAWVLMQSGPQQAMCPGSKNHKMRGCRCSPVGPRQRARTITRNAYTQGKGELSGHLRRA